MNAVDRVVAADGEPLLVLVSGAHRVDTGTVGGVGSGDQADGAGLSRELRDALLA